MRDNLFRLFTGINGRSSEMQRQAAWITIIYPRTLCRILRE